MAPRKWLYRTLLLFIFLNVLLAVFYGFKDYFFPSNPIFRQYGKEVTLAAYPHEPPEEVQRLLQDTWGRNYQAQPWVGFKEKAFQSPFVNVSPKGFRLSDQQGPFPIDANNYNIFIFGGSTTFGYGVKDKQTIASYLQQIAEQNALPIKVYNFGTGFFYSSQERAWLEQLIIAGHKPQALVFIDGINEFFFEDYAGAKSHQLLQDKNTLALSLALLAKLPLIRLARSIRALFIPADTGGQSPHAQPQVFAQACIDRYFKNQALIQAIGQSQGMETYFVWQPISCYKYDLQYHLFKKTPDQNCYPAMGYELMAQQDSLWQHHDHLLYLADMQEHLQENLYVDQVHYTPAMNQRIAQRIFEAFFQDL